MKRTFMIGVAAGALLAGVNFAAAQGAMGQQYPGASGGANIEQKGAVQKKGKGELKAQGGTELKGGAELKGGKARAQGQTELKGGAEVKGKKARAQAGGEAQEPQKPGQKMKGEKGKAGAAAQGDMKAGGATTTGQAAGAAKASLTVEQKTKIRETVIKTGPRVTNVNFSLSVGTVVPRTVRFAPLPLILVEIYPQWRGYEYFIVEEEIIIIEPRTLRIVAVIAV